MKLFSKSLTKTDIRKRLAVPIKSLISFPGLKGGHTVDLRVKDDDDRVWTFRCTVRRKQHLKPVFCSGWCKFVRSKNLNVGDKVKFYKEADEAAGTSYKIRAKKPVKIFGVIFGYTNTSY